MAFSGSSYFAGIGTAFVAIAFGFAGGAMITNSPVQPPNRLERVAAGTVLPADAPPPSTASASPEQANTAKPAPQEAPPSPVVAAAPPPADPQPAESKTDTAKTDTAKTEATKTDATANVEAQPAPATAAKNPPPSVAKGDSAAPAKNEHTTVGRAADPNRDASRSADPNKDVSRKRADERKPDDRKFSDRRRRQDQDDRRLDEATNVVRQMPRGAADEIVERYDAPRFRERPRRFELFGDDDGPRMVREPPPRFGFFGD